MSLALLLALQSAPQAPTAPPLRIDFDLAKVKPADPCKTGGGGSIIVVCGRRPKDFDFEKWERLFKTDPLLAEKSLGPGTVARAYVESAGMPGGQNSKRAMVGIRVKF